jgi:hypothetical protein
LKLQEHKLASDAEKLRIQTIVRNGIGRATIEINGSAYHHNRLGRKGKSWNVGRMDNSETDDFIYQYLIPGNIHYTGPGDYGGHECVINLPRRETIVFAYYEESGSATVFHCGPGG